VLDNHKVSLIFKGHAKVIQESISRLSHDHGAEELATEPSSTSWRNRGFNDGNLEVWTSFAQHVSSTETTGSCSNNDNVGLRIGVEIGEVATGHGTRDLRLADGSECEALLPLVSQLAESLSLRLGSIDCEALEVKGILQRCSLSVSGLGKHCCWWRHDGRICCLGT